MLSRSICKATLRLYFRTCTVLSVTLGKLQPSFYGGVISSLAEQSQTHDLRIDEEWNGIKVLTFSLRCIGQLVQCIFPAIPQTNTANRLILVEVVFNLRQQQRLRKGKDIESIRQCWEGKIPCRGLLDEVVSNSLLEAV